MIEFIYRGLDIRHWNVIHNYFKTGFVQAIFKVNHRSVWSVHWLSLFRNIHILFKMFATKFST